MELRTHTCGALRKEHVGETIQLSGWVHRRRDLGGLIFIDIRDRFGITQVVFHPETCNDFALAESLKYEHIISVGGDVVARSEQTVNADLDTGTIEIHST